MKLLTALVLSLILTFAAIAQQAKNAPAQDFTVTTIDNEVIELSKLKGKVVLMTFWSTRCLICVEEIPSLNKLAKRHGDDVVFLGLAWQDKKKLDVFLKERPFDFKIVPQSFAVLLKYAPRDSNGRLNMGYPSHFLIDKGGNVVFMGSGFSQTKKLESKISELVSQDNSVD